MLTLSHYTISALKHDREKKKPLRIVLTKMENSAAKEMTPRYDKAPLVGMQRLYLRERLHSLGAQNTI